MRGFDSVLSAREIDDTIMLIEAFAPAAFAARTAPASPLPEPPAGAADLTRGAAVWTQLGCASCHGARGTGETSVAPFDLTAEPLRRPHARGATVEAAALDVWTGLGGTSMPGYAGVIGTTDLWALAAYVAALGPREPSPSPLGLLAADAVAADRHAPLVVGTRPSGGDAAEDALFGAAIAPQGPPPAALAPAEASLHARQCGRCHAKQLREWTGSIHGAAASPGLRAQIDVMPDAAAASCRRCHTPLAEQQPRAGAAYDLALQVEGVTCAGCHVRAWVRHGPPGVAPSLLTLPGYPLQTLPIYERADLCMTCHQLPPRTAVAGKPLLNTYAEWLGGPYAPRGVQCQHCHMPNREHAVLGIHDRETVRQGIELTASATPAIGGAIGVVASLRNIGAGHDLPTTPTPAVWLAAELVDARGAALPETRVARRLGRAIEYREAGWRERSDTRIAPGQSVLLVDGWPAKRARGAVAVRVTVTVRPDDYYEHFYEQRLAAHPAPAQRALYDQALARARASVYTAEDRLLPL